MVTLLHEMRRRGNITASPRCASRRHGLATISKRFNEPLRLFFSAPTARRQMII
jgi:hypothetical protein